jgi:hypothetical protein
MTSNKPEKGDKGKRALTHSCLFNRDISPIQDRISLRKLNYTLPLFRTSYTGQAACLPPVVSWNWGGGAPGGTVAETKDEGGIAIKSKRGNTIKKNASPDNPAVHITRSGNDVVKRASELTVEEKAPANKSKGGRKRGARTQDPETEEEEEEEEEGEGGDQEDPHRKNKQGKEVKKGGKEANKRQKRRQDEDAKGNAKDLNSSKEDKAAEETMEEEEDVKDEKPKKAIGNKKSAATKRAEVVGEGDETKSSGKKSNSKAKKDPTQRKDDDTVSTRTRSQGKRK